MLLSTLNAMAQVNGLQQAENMVIKKGMIKVTILYPGGEGKKFDMDYYTKKHFPLLKTLFGCFKGDRHRQRNSRRRPRRTGAFCSRRLPVF